MRLALCVLCVLGGSLVCAGSALGDSLEDRAKILRAEMVRDAAELHPFLKQGAEPAMRRLAIRALGRIGDDGTGPGILRDLLATATHENEKDLGLLLWSAGIARTKELHEPLKEQLLALVSAEQWTLVAEAARALGWTGGDDVVDGLDVLLGHEQAVVRAGALEGIARAGGKSRDLLVKAAALAHDEDPDVRRAADYACWLIAGRFARAAKQADKAWDGDSVLAARFVKHLDAEDPERRLAGVRVLASLLSEAVKSSTLPGVVAVRLDDPDPRVVQEVVSRVLARRKGKVYDDYLVEALAHADPKVRSMAADALGERDHEGAEVRYALWKRLEVEQDARVREDVVVALVKHGAELAWKKHLAPRKDRPADPAVRQTTEALVLLHSKRKEALDELFVWADPGASQRAGNIHPVVWMTILGGLEGKDHPKLDEWLMGFLAGGYAVQKPDRHFVIASAVSLVGANKRLAHAGTLLDMLKRAYGGPPPHDEIKDAALHEEIRSALMGAFADLAGTEACPPETKAAMIKALGKHVSDDPSPWVRRAADAAFTKLKEETPELPDFDTRNGWKGVPRALKPADGIPTPAGEGEWLDEKGILQLADWIAQAKPLIAFVTTAGAITVELDPVNAPVHSVSLLNAVRNGIYADTRWHRVVPSFVIQGGDPHGHGAGGGGWTVPDEISKNRYVRGALGMPKSTKDDGGCQLFFMHSSYRPLDERYTCYGKVVQGLDVVDKIRVGDMILSAHVAYGK